MGLVCWLGRLLLAGCRTWKSDLSTTIKRNFFFVMAVSVLRCWFNIWILTKIIEY